MRPETESVLAPDANAAKPVIDGDGKLLGTVTEVDGLFHPSTDKDLALAPCKSFRAAAAALRAIAAKPSKIALDGKSIGTIAGTPAHTAVYDRDGALIGVFPRPKALQMLIAIALGQMELAL